MYRKHPTIQERSLRNQGMQRSFEVRYFRVVAVSACAILGFLVTGYLFLVNRNAVAGYSLRVIENRMTGLSEESQKLRIREAELRSLYGIEAASSRLGMIPIQDAVFLDEPGPIAYGK